MGGYSVGKSKQKSDTRTYAGSELHPAATDRVYEMIVPGHFDPLVEKSVTGMQSLQDFAAKLLAGEPTGRDAGYDAEMAGLARMGLATSAPGITAQSNNIFSRRMEGARLLEQASQGLAYLRALPEEMRMKMLQLLLGQTATIGHSEGQSFNKSGYVMGGGGGSSTTSSGGGQ